MTEIHGPPGTETDRSESVRDLQFFLDPGPVRVDSIFNLFGPGPCWSEIFSVLVLDFLNFLSRGPVLGPGPKHSIRDQPVLACGSRSQLQNRSLNT